MQETEFAPALVTNEMFEKLSGQLPKEPGFARRFVLILQIGGNEPVSATELHPSQLLHKFEECAKLVAGVNDPALQLVRQWKEDKVVFFLAEREPPSPELYLETIRKYLKWCSEHDVTPHRVGSPEFDKDIKAWVSAGLLHAITVD